MITALFRDRESAERAYRVLMQRGYTENDVTLIMSDETRDHHFKNDDRDTELGDNALEGAGVGSAIGGTVGAVLAAVAAIGTSIALPGIGLVVAGPLAAALAGAGAGGLTGGLVGALVGSGIPEEHAKTYDEGMRQGGIVMSFQPRSAEDAEYIEREWGSGGAKALLGEYGRATAAAVGDPDSSSSGYESMDDGYDSNAPVQPQPIYNDYESGVSATKSIDDGFESVTPPDQAAYVAAALAEVRKVVHLRPPETTPHLVSSAQLTDWAATMPESMIFLV